MRLVGVGGIGAFSWRSSSLVNSDTITLPPPLARKRSDARGLIDRRGFAAKWPFLSISACRTSHCMRACILAHYHLRARFSSSSFCTLILSRALGRHIAGDRVI